MGVTGLWKLIEQSGKEVSIETLENKVLAVDISIWLHQVIKGFQDRKGNALQNAHLLGLFNRLCKLLFYKIKPVFIFDGSVPILKRETIAKRQQGRTKILKEVERIQELLQEAMSKEKILKRALNPVVSKELPSDASNEKGKKENDEGIFTIPEYLSPTKAVEDPTSSSDLNTSLSENDNFDDSSMQHYYNINLQSIDVTSSHFKSLPADVRLEILADIREMRKQHSWGRLHEMPTESNNFSDFQMKRLLKRRQVQVSLEEAEKELEGRCLTLSELETFLSEQGIVQAEKSAKSRINSDANTRFLLVKDLKKAIEKAAKLELPKNDSTEVGVVVKEEKNMKDNEGDFSQDEVILDAFGINTNKSSSSNKNWDKNNYIDTDLELAIQLSLNQTNAYNDKDYLSTKASLNKEQKNMFKNATGSAKDYLLKYGLIKNLDVDEIDKSQIEITENYDLLNNLKHNTSLVAEIKCGKTNLQSTKNKPVSDCDLKNREQSTINEEATIGSDSDTDNEVDFVEVNDSDNIIDNLEKNEIIQIQLDATKTIKPQDDMFADIFLKENIKSTNKKCHLKIKTSQNKKRNMTDILEGLQKEVLDVTKLSLDNIISENILIEVPDSQETEFSKNSILENNSKISIEMYSSSLESIIEIPDSQENHFVRKFDTNLKDKISEIQSQNSFESDRVIEILDSQENELDKKNKMKLLEHFSNDEFKTEILKTIETEIDKSDLQNDEIINEANKDFELCQNKVCNSQNIDIKTDDSVKLLEANEVIEIIDDSFGVLQKTPSKQKIEDFFKTEYLIKKTPGKDEDNKYMTTPSKAVSNSLLKKTPGSSGNKEPREDKLTKSLSKVSKELFELENKKKENKTEKEAKLIEKESALLRNGKSKEELEILATKLDQEKYELEKERNRQDRMGLTITEKMKRDCMDLLKLFGVPYIVAPMEAEAQCAFLEAAELTQGTITDDSDIWLFGGRTVYKNFFDKQKHVVEFKSEQIHRDFSLDRDKLIQLAFLVGSDYTIGIKGIGTVTALEILAAFPNIPVVKNETTRVMSILSSLRKFRDWFNNNKTEGADSVKVKLKTQLKNIEITTGFPNLAVAEAYLHPSVDDSEEPFTWGIPNLEEIKKFARKYFGWTPVKTDETLRPVLKRLEQKKSQTTIKNFFNVKHSVYKKEVKYSKRVEKAVKAMVRNNSSGEDELVKKIESKKTQKSKKDKDSGINSSKCTSNRKRKTKNGANMIVQPDEPSTAEQAFDGSPEKKIKTTETDDIKKHCIPQAKEVIPQRENDISEMNKRKEVASALFKRSRAAAKKSNKV
ncbi:uncharacterized protein LOC129605856 [Condylostylus longicornis]|uniref:uncharacterized protein LOC129605856 n=1 Tax=Condylostylus longicornis TaxID=2530218 RepID=UPI00244E477B|nr:uncharacterized protein LOC129605856 [Condylostylus longicornis]